MKTLEQILTETKQYRHEDGEFGIKACKESIKFDLELSEKYNEGKTLFTLLEHYYYRANHECLFNDLMVLACWELINEKAE